MTPPAAHVSTPCSARSAPVLDASRSARRSGACSRTTDWSDEPEAVCLSPPAKRKEYRDHHNHQPTSPLNKGEAEMTNQNNGPALAFCFLSACFLLTAADSEATE